MKTPRFGIGAALLALPPVLAAAPAPGRDSHALPPGHPAVIYMIVPAQEADRNPAMKEGCWARFYGGKNYTGDMLALVGPADMPNMAAGPFGISWRDKIGSLQTGSKATVVVFDNVSYQDPVSTFMPGQMVPDVSRRMGYFDQFGSLRIYCGKQ